METPDCVSVAVSYHALDLRWTVYSAEEDMAVTPTTLELATEGLLACARLVAALG